MAVILDELAKRVKYFKGEGDNVEPSSLIAASKFLDGVQFVPRITLGPNGTIHCKWRANESDTFKLIAELKLETRVRYVWFIPCDNVTGRKYYTGEMPIDDFKHIFEIELGLLWYYGTNLEIGHKNT